MALGGGSNVDTTSTGVSLNSSFPEPSTTGGPIDSWGVDVNNTTTTDVPFIVYAICATTN